MKVLYIDEKLHENLKAEASKGGISLTAYVSEIFSQRGEININFIYLKNKKKNKKNNEDEFGITIKPDEIIEEQEPSEEKENMDFID